MSKNEEISLMISQLKENLSKIKNVDEGDVEDWRDEVDEDYKDYYDDLQDSDFSQLFDFVLNDSLPLSSLLSTKQYLSDLSKNDKLLSLLDDKYNEDIGSRIKKLNDYSENIDNDVSSYIEDVKIKSAILFKGNQIEYFANAIPEPFRSMYIASLNIVYSYMYNHDDFIDDFDFETTEEDLRNYFTVEDAFIIGEQNLDVITTSWAKLTIYYDDFETMEVVQEVDDDEPDYDQDEDRYDDRENSEDEDYESNDYDDFDELQEDGKMDNKYEEEFEIDNDFGDEYADMSNESTE